MTVSVEVTVPAVFAPYVGQALVRLSYLHPRTSFVSHPDRIIAHSPEGATVSAREITYQLYREKIYQESLPMRDLLYRTLLS